MGNIMAPSYSGIFMGELEQRLIQLDPERIKLWLRYIDDILIMWSGTQTEFQTFLNNCNQLHPTMKFTGECSPNTIHFLDLTLYKGENFEQKGTLDMKTYTKPTNKQTYVHSSSFHPKGTRKSIILGEAYRFLRTNTHNSDFREQMYKLQKALLIRGYKRKMVKTILHKIHFRDRKRILHKQKTLKPKTTTTPVLILKYNTHIHEVKEKIQTIWLDVKKDPLLNQLYPEPPRIALKRNQSLRDMLVRAKLKRETALQFPSDAKPFDTYQHCRIPPNYPDNLRHH